MSKALSDAALNEAGGPLSDLRVLDLSRLVAGNMLSVTLADFGADVIKVERPGRGDDLRNWTENGISNWWKTYGRNKRSLALEMRAPGSIELIKSLVAHCDVLIENFVPGKLEEMGLAPEVLHEINAKLVIVRVSGWGQTGPYAHKPGFGTLVEGMSGYAHLNGFPDKPPALPPLATADMVAGLYGAFAVMVAVREVERGGEGQTVDLSLFESIFSIVSMEAVKHRATGAVSMRTGNQSFNTAPRNVYVCKDGKYLALSGSMQSMFERIMTTIGRPDLISDPRFETNTARVENRDALDEILQDYFLQRDLAGNLEIMEAARVTVGPILSVEDLVTHPYIQGRGILEEVADADGQSWPLHVPVPRLSRTPGKIRNPAPDVGADTDEILALLGNKVR